MQFQKTRGSLDTIIFFFFPLSHVFFMSLKQRAPVGPRATAAGEECEAVERGCRAGAREGEEVIEQGMSIQCIVKKPFFFHLPNAPESYY